MSAGVGTGVDVRVISVTDDAAMRTWYAVLAAAEAEHPLFLWPSYDAAMRVWREPRTDFVEVFLLATRDGAAAGAGRVLLPQRDNLHVAAGKVLVDPTSPSGARSQENREHPASRCGPCPGARPGPASVPPRSPCSRSSTAWPPSPRQTGQRASIP